jgi:hypothetical protein
MMVDKAVESIQPGLDSAVEKIQPQWNRKFCQAM